MAYSRTFKGSLSFANAHLLEAALDMTELFNHHDLAAARGVDEGRPSDGSPYDLSVYR